MTLTTARRRCRTDGGAPVVTSPFLGYGRYMLAISALAVVLIVLVLIVVVAVAVMYMIRRGRAGHVLISKPQVRRKGSR